jgi:aminoglycoside phosphotransferase family enzyme
MDRLRARADAALRERALSGALRDGHGDLRPEHIALLDPPRVIDALEFDAALRAQDPFEELAFLALECERLGAAWIGPRLMAQWSATCREPAPGDLMPLYTARRALLRARLALAHLLEPDVRHTERWLPLARWYLQRASQALAA